MHLGSPVNTTDPYVRSVNKAVSLIDALRSDGHSITALNIGGGFGANYEGDEAPAARDYADVIIPILRDKGLTLILEPGRSIAANAGVLVGRSTRSRASSL